MKVSGVESGALLGWMRTNTWNLTGYNETSICKKKLRQNCSNILKIMASNPLKITGNLSLTGSNPPSQKLVQKLSKSLILLFHSGCSIKINFRSFLALI
jgi:hypothetical protein